LKFDFFLSNTLEFDIFLYFPLKSGTRQHTKSSKVWNNYCRSRKKLRCVGEGCIYTKLDKQRRRGSKGLEAGSCNFPTDNCKFLKINACSKFQFCP